MIRVGIPILGSKNWMGGVTYVELLARSNAARRAETRLQLFLVIRAETVEALELHKPFLSLFNHVIFWVPQGMDPPHSGNVLICHDRDELFRLIDVYFPLPWDAWPDHRAASWIPDFQHRFLPHFFSGQECEIRDRDIRKVAHESGFVVLSSRTAERHFHRFHPECRAPIRILPFHTRVDPATFESNSAAVASRYGLPDHFLICCNQFWIHKDHSTVFRALALCRDRGLTLTLACTGAMEDYRHPGYGDQIKVLLRELRLEQQVVLLGTLPREDQLQLIRRSAAVVQPSLFEGWSTVVEDGRAFGKIQFLSDLEVHREQNPPHAIFFPPGSPEALSQAIFEAAPALLPGPDSAREREASAEGAEQVRAYGECFERLVEDCLKSPVGSDAAATPVISVREKIRVSAIVSAYNSARLLPACLEDLAEQTLGDQLEVIVVDSGSPQDEGRIVEEYRGRIPNLRYVRTVRETLYGAWNRGVRLSRGRFVTNANTDDAHQPFALERLAESLDRHPTADFAYAWCDWTNVANDRFADSHAYRHVRYPAWDPAQGMLWCFLGPHPVWRRSLFDKIGFFEPGFAAAGDFEHQLRLILADGHGVLVPEVLSLFYQNPNGLTYQDTKSADEVRVLGERYRKIMPIQKLWKIDAENPMEVARAWTSQGCLALNYMPPWLDAPVVDPHYAKLCFNAALQTDPDCRNAMRGLEALGERGHQAEIPTTESLLAFGLKAAHANV